MQLLNSADGPYNLTLNTLIKAIVSATNVQGSGAYSIVNTVGVKVQTKP